MTQSLHQDLTDIILKVAHANHVPFNDYVSKQASSEAAGAVIAKIVERLPEKRKSGIVRTEEDRAWNAYHDTLKDLLTGGKESNDKT